LYKVGTEKLCYGKKITQSEVLSQHNAKKGNLRQMISVEDVGKTVALERKE